MHYPRRASRHAQLRGLGATSLVSSALNAAQNVARSQIRRVVIRSAVSPSISLSPDEAVGTVPRDTGFGEMFLKFAKPSIELETTFGNMKVAPWGEPRFNLFWPVFVGTVVGGALIVGYTLRRLRK